MSMSVHLVVTLQLKNGTFSIILGSIRVVMFKHIALLTQVFMSADVTSVRFFNEWHMTSS